MTNRNETREIEQRLEFINERKLPAVLMGSEAESLSTLLARFHQPLQELLLKHGAILFRNFAIHSADQFGEFATQFFGEMPKPYVGGTSPRGQVSASVYESTNFPSHLRLPLHNEMSYLGACPGKIAFFCDIAPGRGGETPLADCREILLLIPPALRQTMETRGIRYCRYLYGPRWNRWSVTLHRVVPLHRSWMEAFQTTDRAEVERICATQGVSVEWDDEEGGCLVNALPAARAHPITGEKVWFNQAASFCLTPRTSGMARWLLYQIAWPNVKQRPFHAQFATGEAISVRQLNEVNRAIDCATVSFPWRQRDLLLADNYLVAHGRNPFRGPRRILVAMS